MQIKHLFSKPVLAWEREARFKKEHFGDDVQTRRSGKTQRANAKHILTFPVVFAHPWRRRGENIWKNMKNILKLRRKHTKHTKLSLDPPPCGPVSQKNTGESPKTPQASQRHPKGRHENAKETPEDPKGRQKSGGGLPKRTKNVKQTEKERQAKT